MAALLAYRRLSEIDAKAKSRQFFEHYNKAPVTVIKRGEKKEDED